ncbi:MAG TPA: transglutaminase domain-containing protein [Acidimicrobiales bacterium]
MSFVDRVRRANEPGPPEDSILFRMSAAGTVAVAIAACWAQGELGASTAVGAVILVALGNVFSYHRRRNPLPWLKLGLAVAVSGAFVWFFVSVSARTTIGDLSSVEGPLAVLFTWIQVTHAFDVPSRRDLGFSLAGSATLMAVAAAQAVDSTFGIYVVVWAAIGIAGLSAMWSSMAGGAPVRLRPVLSSFTGVLVVGVGLVALLPPPHASSTVLFPSSLAHDIPLGSSGGLVGGGSDGSEPLRSGSATGPDRVGGLLGFAGPLDTAIRGSLGNQVVVRVRAQRPSFWIAETFDDWSGQSWTETVPAHTTAFHALTYGPPFAVPVPADQASGGVRDIQTFYLAQPGPNLVFHAADATEVWFPTSRLFVADDGTMRTATTMGAGSVYTVESTVSTATAADLRQARSGAPGGARLDPAQAAADTQLPHPYPRVQQLAERITASAPDVYDKVQALEAWIGSHTRYTTDIPPLAKGQDTVTEFLFGNRRGYCEQISTALAVMLRSLGIPAREATGYVPGSFNPITDLYDVEAKDAHAWVQVWFPGYGWQSFDPTAEVPAANPTPARALGHALGAEVRRIPVLPTVAAMALASIAVLWHRRRRRVPATWPATITNELVRAARRGGVAVGDHDPLVAVGANLDRQWPPGDRLETPARLLAWHAEQAAYGRAEPGPAERRALTRAAVRLRRRARRLRKASPLTPGAPGALPPTSPPPPAGGGTP